MDITVRKANSILTIPEEQRDEYLSKGYDIVTETGVVIQRAVPQDVPTLQARLQEALDENARLKARLASVQKPTGETSQQDKSKKVVRTKKS